MTVCAMVALNFAFAILRGLPTFACAIQLDPVIPVQLVTDVLQLVLDVSVSRQQ